MRRDSRQLRKHLLELLQRPDLPAILAELRELPPRRLVKPLFSAICRGEPLLRWHAVSALGAVIAGQAETDPEHARVLIRRLIWSLAEESGGIGWGAPETMGEALALSPLLAREYAPLLWGYLQPGPSFLDHEPLLQGALWGLGRLAHARAQLVAEAAPLLPPLMRYRHAGVRGHAVWAALPLPHETTASTLSALAGDGATFTLYREGTLQTLTIGELARTAPSPDPPA
jgi:hypothetical protein